MALLAVARMMSEFCSRPTADAIRRRAVSSSKSSLEYFNRLKIKVYIAFQEIVTHA